jgi:N-methylhydantoinase B
LRVARDVADGYVTTRWAADLYGVVLGADGAPDLAATTVKRQAIRKLRLGGTAPKSPAPAPQNALPLDLAISADRHFHCACGADLGSVEANWKDKAASRPVTPESCGPHIRLHDELQLREFSCPDCATLLELEVSRKDEQPL